MDIALPPGDLALQRTMMAGKMESTKCSEDKVLKLLFVFSLVERPAILQSKRRKSFKILYMMNC